MITRIPKITVIIALIKPMNILKKNELTRLSRYYMDKRITPAIVVIMPAI